MAVTCDPFSEVKPIIKYSTMNFYEFVDSHLSTYEIRFFFSDTMSIFETAWMNFANIKSLTSENVRFANRFSYISPAIAMTVTVDVLWRHATLA